jgi:hypothetical protein
VDACFVFFTRFSNNTLRLVQRVAFPAHPRPASPLLLLRERRSLLKPHRACSVRRHLSRGGLDFLWHRQAADRSHRSAVRAFSAQRVGPVRIIVVATLHHIVRWANQRPPSLLLV